MNIIKEKLFDEYGGFSDKRIKSLDKGHIFIVDDRSDGDVGADKQLYSYFCLIFADVKSEEEIEVSLRKNVPIGKSVSNWIENNDCVYSEVPDKSLVFNVNKENVNILNELASSISEIVKPGAPRYTTANYQYVCPRTAGSLERLSDILQSIWRT
ncbi:hypothetical protein JYT96_01655 [Gammaproteobacteria bacterium AH-315-C21]|nr:hypothetical protein [Gammaproteobacteria bacterium AH-315-C21]